MSDMQPGQIIIPHGSDEPQPPAGGAPEPERPTEQPAPNPVPTPTPAPEPAAPITPAPILPTPVAPDAAAPLPLAEPAAAEIQPQAPADQTQWAFHQEADTTATHDPLPGNLAWTAAEFIAHDKGAAWYALLALGGAAATAVIYFLTKDKITTGILLFALLAFGGFASRKPRSEQYSLSDHGLQVGQKTYAFHDFRTFSVSEEGSIVLMPLKRFMLPLTLYVAPEMADQVVDFLAAFLPVERHKADAIDSLMRRIHF